MKRILLLLCICFLLCKTSSAFHIKGGWIHYKYLSKASDTSSKYEITLYVYRICNTPNSAFLPMPSNLCIYDAVTYTEIKRISIANTQSNTYYVHGGDTKKQARPPCSSIPDADMPCYAISTFTTTVELTDNPNGYILSTSDATRTTTIVNLTRMGGSPWGISFTANIPGSSTNNKYHINTNPEFIFKDTALLCYNAKFNYNFEATDADGDSLSFSFGDALDGEAPSTQPKPPPYKSMTYANGYSGLSPLGSGVSIDPKTGTVSGTAPATPGLYVVAVYVHEWRNGVKISSTKKEMEIGIGNCSLSPVELKKVYLNCDNYTISLQNEAATNNITAYQWDFGVPTITTDVSTAPTPSYTYTDAGTYTVQLKVSNNQGCQDSASAEVKIYPGFTPLFTIDGSCFEKPIEFKDSSIAKHGSISQWAWDFGDPTTATDVASTQFASYKYPKPTQTSVMLSVTSTVGCSGTVTNPISIYDKPVIKPAFLDTLICDIDSLQLRVQISRGNYQWSPNYMMASTTALQPVVYPKDTTEYTLVVKDNGCIDSVKIKVNVLDFITVRITADTGICRTDSITLRPESLALSYRWRESGSRITLNSHSIKYPIAKPTEDVNYHVVANLGWCQDSTVTKVHVSPYPVSRLGPDTVVCFGHRIPLPAYIEGNQYTWSPTNTLLNANSLRPFAAPSKNVSYVLTVSDNRHCPKIVSDTIHIRVIPAFNVFAGKDTATGINVPLQLTATGADPSFQYTWTPALYLDNSGIANPVATISDATYDAILYTVKASSPEGCSATDDIKVQVYSKGPEIYVPSGFSPNGDGKNDVLQPVLVGISKLTAFTIYNRWGQVLFTTTQPGKGWDGMYKGIKQAPGTYVFTAQGQDYTGKAITRKGTVVLIM
jgi:gliding motility-associated-like protein